MDLDYTVGSANICNNIICCRAEDGILLDEASPFAAGPYGSLGQCDIPPVVLYKMADKINELAPDALFWTGDITPHDMYNVSEEHVREYSDFLTDFMTENLNSWSTYVQDGNHDFGVLINSQDFRDGHRDPIIDH